MNFFRKSTPEVQPAFTVVDGNVLSMAPNRSTANLAVMFAAVLTPEDHEAASQRATSAAVASAVAQLEALPLAAEYREVRAAMETADAAVAAARTKLAAAQKVASGVGLAAVDAADDVAAGQAELARLEGRRARIHDLHQKADRLVRDQLADLTRQGLRATLKELLAESKAAHEKLLAIPGVAEALTKILQPEMAKGLIEGNLAGGLAYASGDAIRLFMKKAPAEEAAPDSAPVAAMLQPA